MTEERRERKKPCKQRRNVETELETRTRTCIYYIAYTKLETRERERGRSALAATLV